MRIDSAIGLAARAHTGQLDKSGKPYIFHPLRVMLAVGDDPVLQTIAVLHDVVEDTWREMSEIVRHLYDPGPHGHEQGRVIDALDAVTHRKGEPNVDYWARVKANPDALAVKLADIADNMDESRLMLLDRDTAMRLRAKYRAALAALTGDAV